MLPTYTYAWEMARTRQTVSANPRAQIPRDVASEIKRRALKEKGDAKRKAKLEAKTKRDAKRKAMLEAKANHVAKQEEKKKNKKEMKKAKNAQLRVSEFQ